MNEKGIRCELKKDATPRAYYPDQQGLGRAEYVLELKDARFDIGFYQTEGGFEARTDFWGQHVEKVLGVQACSATSKEQAKLGKMFQAYGIHAAMESARKQGYSVRRAPGENGAEKLIVTGHFAAA